MRDRLTRRVLSAPMLGAACVVGAMIALLIGAPARAFGLVFYSVWFVWGLGLVLSVWAFGRQGQATSRGPSTMLIMAVALLLRLLALGLEPTLSDDVYRYIWDGRVVLSGADPYALSPDAPQLSSLRDPLWDVMPHKDVETVYPPLAQALFTVAAAFSNPILAWKVLLLVIDLAACWLLLRLLLLANGNPRFALLYAWHPLAVVEGVGMAHLDVAGVALLLLAVACSARFASGAWSAATGAVMALGVLTKLVPIVLLPLWLLGIRNVRFALSFGATLLAGLLPILLGVLVPPGLLRYGVSWEFNGALFEPLWRTLEALRTPEALKNVLFRLRDAGIDVDALFPYVYPQFLAKLMIASVLVTWVMVVAWRHRAARPGSMPWLEAQRTVLIAALVCSATLYPWYLLWVLPFAAVTRSVPALVLSGTIAFAYLPRLFGVDYFPLVWLLVWAPPAVCWLAVNARRRAGIARS